ncbi:hypothetical protein KCP69_20880 [Salmonella enterica subsp. enterica]|nr:hypothetical protein KCP69_20880 [Salmonella enterica subsp. enterica]
MVCLTASYRSACRNGKRLPTLPGYDAPVRDADFAFARGDHTRGVSGPIMRTPAFVQRFTFTVSIQRRNTFGMVIPSLCLRLFSSLANGVFAERRRT